MSASHKRHGVFISFRGEDTRRTFTSHLHNALLKENIEAYIDSSLQKGDGVWPALAQAIQDSHISVVVFSENYASSKWCLSELVKILECRENHGQVVIPVFYNIDPSDVRHQRGSYTEAFARYERDPKKKESSASTEKSRSAQKYERDLRNLESFACTEESGSAQEYERHLRIPESFAYAEESPLTQEDLRNKVPEWRDALKKAANISGWDSRTYRDDFQFIENIVKDVCQKLSQMYPNELKGLVQTDENKEYIESLLREFSRIGVWGMGGMGKTTMARQLFSKHFAEYESVCFLEKVREEAKMFGLPNVRNKLLSELLKKPITTSSVFGSPFIERWLSGRKVFVVLDDVDNATQLEYLCEELGDLGPDSRLIITTRDKHTLSERVGKIHEVTKWGFKESLKLFSLGAFKQSHPKDGYKHLSNRAVEYTRGVPLALKVLASHLRSRKLEFWEHEMNYLENKVKSLPEIQEVLKVSYNGLTRQEQEMFLDIAFFFKDENKDFAKRILDACGFGATNGIDILEDKALITISNSNRIQMHDLLQQMALDIVRIDQGTYSRLRDIEGVRHVLRNKKGADAVQGIVFDLSQKVNLHVQADTFNIMTDLRFLRLYVPLDTKSSTTMYHPEVIMPFSDKLRYLEWYGYPFKSLPQPFYAELLVEIRLPHSNIEHLWHGIQELVNLEAIDLGECKQLIELPDLSGMSKLKWLNLSGCESLCEVQPSIFYKDTLVTLLLDRCKKLQSLISEKHLKSLKKINVYGCSSLKEFSLSLDSIECLDLSNTGIEILQPSIGHLGKIEWLNLEGLRLRNLPNELSRLRSLTQLWISNCNVVTRSKLEALFDGLESLKILYLKDCCNLFELPANISSLSSLYEIRLDGSSVEKLPASIKYLSELEILSLNNCWKLRCVPMLPSHIKKFHADNCTSLVTVSTLKTFSERMNGKDKYISFKNDLELDGPSIDHITEDAILTMKSAAFHNMSVRKYCLVAHSYNYNSVEVCVPGCRVPRQFKYRKTDSSSITIEPPDLSYSLGFIFSVVVSPSHGMKEHGNGAKIQCQCYLEDGREVGYASTWHHKTITDLNLDHVFVWYDPYHSDSILDNDQRKVSFEFCVTTDIGQPDDLFSIKECGVCPIYYTEFRRFLSTMNLDKDIESELCDAIRFEMKSIKGFDEGEGNDIESVESCVENESTSISTQTQNQELDLNEKCHCSYDCLIGPLRYLWRLISAWKGVTANNERTY